jgi:hypothetical protein
MSLFIFEDYGIDFKLIILKGLFKCFIIITMVEENAVCFIKFDRKDINFPNLIADSSYQGL